MIRFISSMTLISLFAVMVCHAQQKTNDTEQAVQPSRARELIKQWVQTERLISEEKTSWQVEKQQMQDLLEIYQKELALLNEELEAAGNGANLIDENKESLNRDIAQYQEAKQMLRSTMATLIPQVQALVARFPAPLTEQLDPDIDFINTTEALDKPRDVIKSIIAILNTAGNFNRSITLAEETRSLANGKKLTVNVLYLGLSQAYYAASSGAVAGTGSPSTNGGWSWSENAAIADQVHNTIAVYEKSAQPQVVDLPVQLQIEEVGE